MRTHTKGDSSVTDDVQQDAVSATVSALALSYLERTLRSGKSVSIPSLGIVIEGDKPQQQPAQNQQAKAATND